MAKSTFDSLNVTGIWMCTYLESIVWEFLVFPSLLHLLIIINNPSAKHSSKKQTKETSCEQKTKKNGVVGLYFGIYFWKISAEQTYGSNPDCMDDQIQVSDNYKISL